MKIKQLIRYKIIYSMLLKILFSNSGNSNFFYNGDELSTKSWGLAIK